MLYRLAGAAFCKILRNLWDNHIGFINLDMVTFSKFQPFHNTDIMDTGAADGRSL